MNPEFLINVLNKEIIDAVFTPSDKRIVCAVSKDKRLLILADPEDTQNKGSVHLFKLDKEKRYTHSATFTGTSEENVTHLGTSIRIVPDADYVDEDCVSFGKFGMNQEITLLSTSLLNTLIDCDETDEKRSDNFGVRLTAFYLTLNGISDGKPIQDVIKIPVEQLHATESAFSEPSNLAEEHVLNFINYEVMLPPDTKNVEGEDLQVLTLLKSKGYTVRLAVNISGRIDFENSNIALYGNSSSVLNVYDSAGNEVDDTSEDGRAIAAMFSPAALTHYDFDVFHVTKLTKEKEDSEANFIDETVIILGIDAEFPTRLLGFETYENYPTDDCPSGWGDSMLGVEGILNEDKEYLDPGNIRVGKESFGFSKAL